MKRIGVFALTFLLVLFVLIGIWEKMGIWFFVALATIIIFTLLGVWLVGNQSVAGKVKNINGGQIAGGALIAFVLLLVVFVVLKRPPSKSAATASPSSTPKILPLPDKLPADTQFVVVAKKGAKSPKIIVPVYYGIEFTPLGRDQANCFNVYTQLGGPFEMCMNSSTCKYTQLEDPEVVQLTSNKPETRIAVRLYDSRVARSQRQC